MLALILYDALDSKGNSSRATHGNKLLSSLRKNEETETPRIISSSWFPWGANSLAWPKIFRPRCTDLFVLNHSKSKILWITIFSFSRQRLDHMFHFIKPPGASYSKAHAQPRRSKALPMLCCCLEQASVYALEIPIDAYCTRIDRIISAERTFPTVTNW